MVPSWSLYEVRYISFSIIIIKRYIYIYSGSSSQPFWDGTNLSKNGAIIVSFNYRLGALGWMAMDHISSEMNGTANLGLLDQIAALKWVQRNIAEFGGDPSNVTAFGSSAGCKSKLMIYISHLTNGYSALCSYMYFICHFGS